MNDLTANEIMVLECVTAKPELQSYFFGKVKSLKWFYPIKGKGLLVPTLNPKPVNTEEEYWAVPSWPVTEYLVRSSEALKDAENSEFAEEYIALIREVTIHAMGAGFGNHRTWWQFSKILRNLPINIISLEIMQHIDFWLSDKFDKYLVGKEISEWVSELIGKTDEHSRKITLALLNALFTIITIDGRYSDGRKEAIFRIDNYQANKFVKKYACLLGEQLGLSVVEVFEEKLTEVLEINGNDKWSNIWRNAIPEHKQNIGKDDADDIVLKLFRDSMLGYIQSDQTAEANKKLSDIIASDYQTIKRIGIYVASECFGIINEETVNFIIGSKNFNDKYRHELWHFLNKNFSEFNNEQKASVIESISGLIVTNDKTGVAEGKPTAYKQANWFAAIKDVDEDANTKYQQCFDIAGIEPDHPDFSCYTGGGVVVDESPLSVSELAAMLESPTELVKFLNEYKHVGNFGEPGLEGLVKTFGALVSLDDCVVLNNLEYFVDLKPHYLNEIFDSYSKLWAEKKQIAWGILWPKLLSFSYTLFQKDSFWQSADNDESGPFIGDKHWVVSTYCRLVESGCEKEARAFDLSLSETVKNTLEVILNRQNGSDFKNDSDAVTIAINSPRGRCLEAYIKLALYQCKNVENNSSEFQSIWAAYEPVFSNELNRPATENEYEFITIVSMYIRNFLYLSNRWTKEKLEKIFGEANSLQWLCAIQAYSYVGFVIPEIHHIFKAKNYYVSLLDDPNLSETVKGCYIEYICVAHIQKIEKLADDESLLGLLLSRKNDEELSKMIWFLWSIRDQDIDVTKEIVFDLWPKLVVLIGQQTSKKRPLASKLALWAEYIKELDVQSKPWLCAVAPFVNDDHNGMSFMEELARLSDTAAAVDVADIWKATLIKPFYVYDLKPLERLFSNLIVQGAEGKAAAKEIAGIYIKNCDENVIRVYRNIMDEKNV
jgi:hypothetical protein